MKAFSEWIERGYKDIASKNRSRTALCSWRFWAQGLKKEILLCGLLRDSGDNCGRPYPLLIMGSGSLKGWEKRWDLLPFACESTWNQTENLSTSMSKDLKTFEEDVVGIKQPSCEWTEFDDERNTLLESGSCASVTHLEDSIAQGSGKAVIIGSLDNEDCRDQFGAMILWHFFLLLLLGSAPINRAQKKIKHSPIVLTIAIN
jgi:type VI secretion system protein VasJ